MNYSEITTLIGEQEHLFSHRCQTITKENLYLPGGDFIDRVHLNSSRNIQTLRSLESIYRSGRLSGSGYLSILPVDQGVEHSAGASFSSNPIYFDPENIVRLAIEGGCNAVVSTIGGLATVARRYAHKIPFIVKLNHNELLTYPNKYDQIMFTSVKNAWNTGAAAVGATIFFGSLASNQQITIQADIIKQKLPEINGGYKELCRYGTNYGKYTEEMYTKLATTHPIDLCRYQVMNCYMGRAGLINSGGPSQGKNDLKESVRTAIINKRAGGMGLIAGRKAFQPFHEGIVLLHAIQDVYLEQKIDIA